LEYGHKYETGNIFLPYICEMASRTRKNLGRDLILSIGELIGLLVHCDVQNTAKFNKIQNSAEYSIHTKSLKKCI